MKELIGKRTWAGSREGLIGRPFQRVVSITGADTLVTDANPNRRALILSNLDPSSLIFVALNKVAVAQQGILIPPNSGIFRAEEYWWGKLAEAEFRAIATLNKVQQTGQQTNSVIGAQTATAAAGTAISFTVPAGQVGIVRLASAGNFVGGAPTVALQLVRGASNVEIARGTAAFTAGTGLELQAADVIRWQVITGVAATTVDFSLSVDTLTDLAAAPASAPLGVWELED